MITQTGNRTNMVLGFGKMLSSDTSQMQESDKDIDEMSVSVCMTTCTIAPLDKEHTHGHHLHGETHLNGFCIYRNKCCDGLRHSEVTLSICCNSPGKVKF